MTRQTFFYRDKPIFGLDVGHGSLKIMQIAHAERVRGLANNQRPSKSKNSPRVVGYGTASFDPKAIKEGLIMQPEKVAEATLGLIDNNLVGSITSKRVAITIPSYSTYTRTMSLPIMDTKDLAEAVRLEAEQYIPVAVEDLYIDYNISRRTKEQLELLVVAAPKRLINSYMDLAAILGLEVVALEPTISAASRLFVGSGKADISTALIDFGSMSTDITIFDNNLFATSTVQGGGDDFTRLIRQKIGVTAQEATIIKSKYGLDVSKKQHEIVEALSPLLEQLVKEIKRMIRYYADHGDKTQKKIEQVITLGGGANMPGLAEYLTDNLRLPVRTSDPWQYLDFGHLQPPNNAEKALYATVAGLALIDSQELLS